MKLVFFTGDGDDVEQSSHSLWADVTEPILSHQQLGQVKGHLSGDGSLHLTASICVLERKFDIFYKAGWSIFFHRWLSIPHSTLLQL